MCGSKIVNVVLNSNNKVSGANNDAVYSIDWSSILKDRTAYRLHWTYVGQSNVITAASKIAQVQVNFVMEQYTGSGVGASSTFTIGALRTNYVNGTINYLFADDNNNTPIYLANRPYGNTFTVQVLTNDSPPVLWKDNTAVTPVVNGNYILTLSFQEMGNEE
jgi:hypothetical protein